MALGGCGGRCWNVILQRFTLPGDTPDAVQRNVTTFVLFCAAAMVLLSLAVNINASPYTRVTAWIGVPFVVALVVSFWVLRRVTDRLLWFGCTALFLIIASQDINTSTQFRRQWPAFILVVDLLLLARAPRWMSSTMVALTSLFLVVMEVETYYRIGVLDLPGLVSYDKRAVVCECAKPPCPPEKSSPLREWYLFLHSMSSIVVFLLDFFMTRRFAESELRERGRIQRTMTATEHVASCLVRYDLAAAAAYLEEHTAELPDDLLRTLGALVVNLQKYRVYLPAELFETVQGDDPPVLPPGAPGVTSGRAAIVFTDIRSSTSLWEHSGGAMHGALLTHNAIARAAAKAFCGYEVKTIGDSFMVAFEAAADAVRFGIQMQSDVREMDTAGLSRPEMEEDGYSVLAVRIGIHCGDVALDLNTLTGRCDYLGPAVNKAARVEAHALAGVVTVTDEVADRCEEVIAELSIEVMPYAELRYGKGLAEPLNLTALVPRELGAERLDFYRQLCSAQISSPRACQRAARLGSLQSVASHPAASSHTSEGAGCLDTSPWQRTARGSATVGVVKYNHWRGNHASWHAAEHDATLKLQILHAQVTATHGNISTVVQNIVIASWGLHVRRGRHVRDAAAFAHNAGTESQHLHCGLCVGPVATGQLAVSPAQLVVSLMGPCVDVALMLCSGAAEVKTAALVASLSGAEEEDWGGRQVLDWWNVGSGSEAIAVFELKVDRGVKKDKDGVTCLLSSLSSRREELSEERSPESEGHWGDVQLPQAIVPLIPHADRPGTPTYADSSSNAYMREVRLQFALAQCDATGRFASAHILSSPTSLLSSIAVPEPPMLMSISK